MSASSAFAIGIHELVSSALLTSWYLPSTDMIYRSVISAAYLAFFSKAPSLSSLKYCAANTMKITPSKMMLVRIIEQHMVKYLLTSPRCIDLPPLTLLVDFRQKSRCIPCTAAWNSYSFTSNLYPTPHTVFRLHLSDTPSSFSRRRLTCTSTVLESP